MLSYIKKITCLPIIAILLATPITLRATLIFENPNQTHSPNYGETETIGLFEFENKGQKVVTILNVKSSCGCTVPQLEKKVYQPRESGTIKAVFTHGDRKGRQIKSITVSTDDPQNPKYRLNLNVNIPYPLMVTPKMLVWKKTDKELKPKKINVKIARDIKPVHITEISSSNPAFQFEVKPVPDRKDFEIFVTPKPSKPMASLRGTLTIVTDIPETTTVYMRIR